MLEGPDRPCFPRGVPMGRAWLCWQYPAPWEKMEEEAQRQLD